MPTEDPQVILLLWTKSQSRRAAQIAALLAQADSTTFEAEAETFLAKAQELMSRYSVTEAMLAARHPGARVRPTSAKVRIPEPYSRAKREILESVATANYCQVVGSASLGEDASYTCTVFGYDSDLRASQALYTHLMVLASRELITALADLVDSSHVKSFARDFYIGFGRRIGDRLAEMRRKVEAEAAVEASFSDLLPVLADRSSAVTDAKRVAFPKLKKWSISPVNSRGFSRGEAAGSRANLSPGLGGSQKSLGSFIRIH